MRLIPALYECEICKRIYETEAEAVECESFGLPVADKERFPIGMILGDKGGFYDGITFAIAAYDEASGHDVGYSMWACRTRNGDSLGNETCGSCNGQRLRELIGTKCNHDPGSDTFKRMVAWLESQGMPVVVWNGDKPIPLAQFLSYPE